MSALPRAGGRPCPKGSGSISTLPPGGLDGRSGRGRERRGPATRDGPVQLAPAEHLDQGALADEARCDRAARA